MTGNEEVHLKATSLSNVIKLRGQYQIDNEVIGRNWGVYGFSTIPTTAAVISQLEE